jgi:hypothetical protein
MQIGTSAPSAMKIFTRKPAAPTAPVGTQLCRARGCANYTAVPCAYVDRRGRACQAAYCPSHSAVIDGAVYCRRHAGTIRALGAAAQDTRSLPDLENRAPSLVNWIAADLDPRIRTLLESIRHGEEKVLVNDEVAIAYDHERRPRWERSWKLVDATGLVLKVSIQVDDRNDAQVTVRVGHEMVAKGVPPWISRRREQGEGSDAVDRSQRQLFYRFLEENITAAVHRLRERADHPTWVA